MTGTKRKAPIRKTAFQAFIATYLVTCATLEADTTTPREAVFKRGEQLLSEVVFEAAAYTERNNMRFSPVNLPTGASWGKYGLKAPFIIVLGHFETSSLNLLGVLLAARSKKKDGLRAPVWNILDNYVGRGILAASAVVVNICVFTAGHNAGTTLYDGIPAEAVELMHRLRVVTLNALGNPKKVGGFGGGVREWIKKHLRPNRRALWTTFKGEIDDACVHLCMFTSITKKNFIRSNWFERFGHLVQFISGKRGAGARLKQVLTKDGKYDEALAKRMEEDHRELCRKNAALTGFGGKYETEKQRNARALNCFGSKNETEKQRNARALNCALHGFGSKNETEKQKNAHALNGFGSKNETEKQRNATSNLGNVGSRTTDGVQGRNVPPGAKCRVCGCDIGTGRALVLSVGVSNLRPCGSYFCAGKCNKAIYFNIDRLKEIITKCNEHQPLQGGVTGFVESFAKLWFKKKKEKKPKGKEKK